MYRASEELLRAAALRVHGRHLDPLAARMARAIRENEPLYHDPAHAPGDIDQVIRDIVAAALTGLADPATAGNDSAELLYRLGGHRARQGIPLDTVLRNYRLGTGLFWESLVVAAEPHDSERATLMARAATSVWDLFDRDSRVIADAYRQARSGSGGPAASQAGQTLGRYLDGRLPVGSALAAATVLGLNPQEDLIVVAFRGREPVRRAAGAPLVRLPRPWDGLSIVSTGGMDTAALARTLTVPPGTRAGISPPAADLNGLPRARRLAERALRTCVRDGEAALLDRRFAAGLAAGPPELVREVADGALGRVLQAPPAERAALLDTLDAWLTADGSMERAAATLYCHRNTVLKRLNRLEQLTGRSVFRPRDLVALTLALNVCRPAGRR